MYFFILEHCKNTHDIRKDYIDKRLITLTHEQHIGTGSVCPCVCTLVLHDSSYGHMFNTITTGRFYLKKILCMVIKSLIRWYIKHFVWQI